MTTKETLITICYIGIGLCISILVFEFFKFIGWKGMIGFIVGIFITAYLILSKNLTLWAITRILSKKNKGFDEDFLKEMFNEEKKEKCIETQNKK